MTRKKSKSCWTSPPQMSWGGSSTTVCVFNRSDMCVLCAVLSVPCFVQPTPNRTITAVMLSPEPFLRHSATSSSATTPIVSGSAPEHVRGTVHSIHLPPSPLSEPTTAVGGRD